MRRRTLLAAALVAPAAAVSSARAGEGGQPKIVGQYVDMAPLALPVVDGGRLRNYVFVFVRLLLYPSVDPNKIREKEPYFRDALVRAAHRRPFTVPGDWMSLDFNTMKAVMMREAQAVVGPGVVSQIAMPSKPAPQHHVSSSSPRR